MKQTIFEFPQQKQSYLNTNMRATFIIFSFHASFLTSILMNIAVEYSRVHADVLFCQSVFCCCCVVAESDVTQISPHTHLGVYHVTCAVRSWKHTSEIQLIWATLSCDHVEQVIKHQADRICDCSQIPSRQLKRSAALNS